MVAVALAKARRRLLPFLFLLYVVSYLDRINVGFAALQMNDALHFSSVTYSLGAGVFFLSYTLFEIPSNVVLARVGARLWIARIMITWGLISASMMFVRSAGGFYVLRFLLGAAEAGFFPGIIYVLTRWFPKRERARAIAGFMTAVVVAGVVGGPVSAVLLSMDGVAGLAGWQWLFLVEGVPAVVLGVLVLRVLPEQPSDARWLTSEEQRALTARLEEEVLFDRSAVHTIRGAMTSARVWLLAAVYFTIPVALYAMGFWMPQIVRNASGGNNATVALLSAIPYAVAAVGMVVIGRNSDRTGERRWHIALTAIVGGLSFAATGLVHGVVPLVTLSLAMLGLASMLGPFWALATSFLTGIGAAAGIALVNSVGNIGGFVGPNIIGFAQQTAHGVAGGLILIGAILAGGGLLVLTLDAGNTRGAPLV